MNSETVIKSNVMFFVVVVGKILSMEDFAMSVLESSMEVCDFPIDIAGRSGYIVIDSSAIRKKGDDLWLEFLDEIRAGLLTKISCEFSKTKFEGSLAEQVIIKSDGYKFSFVIRQYERDPEHGCEIIDSFNLGNVPEEENLGRVVYLIIEKENRRPL